MIALSLSLTLLVAVATGDELAALAEEGRWVAVREQAEARLLADPGDEAARYWLGRERLEEAWGLLDGDRLARHLGRSVLQRAISQMGAGLSAGPEDAEEWWLRGRYSWHELHDGRPELSGDSTVLDDLRAAWEQRSVAVAAYLLGWEALRVGEEPGPWFARAATAAPERSAFALEWATQLSLDGDREGAVAAWRQAAAGDDSQPDELLARLVALLPAASDAERRLGLIDLLDQDDLGVVAWYRAHAHDQLGQPDLALAAFDAGQRERTPAMEREHARLLAALGRAEEALRRLLPLAEVRDWEALDQFVSVADGEAQARRFDGALAAYDQALAIEPRHERALRHRAIALWQAGRRSAALEAWRAVVERHPGRSDLVNDAALAAWGLGDLGLARERLEQAAALPGSIDARENLAVLVLEGAEADGQRAVQLLDGVLAEEPDRDRALLYRYRALRAVRPSD